MRRLKVVPEPRPPDAVGSRAERDAAGAPAESGADRAPAESAADRRPGELAVPGANGLRTGPAAAGQDGHQRPAPSAAAALAEVAHDRVLTVPNALSGLRLALVPVFFWLILRHRDGWALAVLAVSGFTDYLDGDLARRWRQVSRLGQLLDPVADRLYILATLLGLAWRDVVPWWLVAAVVARDVLLSFTIPVLARSGYGPLPVHFLGKAATFCLLYAFPLLLLAQIGGAVGHAALVVGWAFAWWGTGLYWWAGWLYVRQVRQVVVQG
jgi:cardiolipin synthase (CMP-forming)